MWDHACLLMGLLVSAAQLRVEVRNSEVWLVRDGQESQLTSDRKAKLQAVLSPAENRIAYYEQCPEPEHCTPAVVVLDLAGRRILSFEPKPQAVPPIVSCGSILSIVWVSDHVIGAECHINPSLSEYVETDISTGQTTRDLLGFGFAPSPDGQHVAHMGWMPHFAPPYAKSSYLQIDRTTVYPLPPGMSPVEQKDLSGPPRVFQERGLTYSGIHEFASNLSWSPDSQRVALVDCSYDWTANTAQSMSAGDGRESNRRCSLAVVSHSGELVLLPLTDTRLNDVRAAQVSWTGPRRIALRAQDMTKALDIP